MATKLLLNPLASPFPFAPLLLAKQLQDLEILFESTTNAALLQINSQSFSNVDEISNILGKQLGLKSDRAKVESSHFELI